LSFPRKRPPGYAGVVLSLAKLGGRLLDPRVRGGDELSVPPLKGRGEKAMELGLRGRKALVTGASRGIGRACAEVLAEEGCDVVLVSRTAADLEAVRAKITAQHNVAARYFPLDLSDS
jgi:NADPH:quinone reductase-like Zn-dependent oxidoreductase